MKWIEAIPPSRGASPPIVCCFLLVGYFEWEDSSRTLQQHEAER